MDDGEEDSVVESSFAARIRAIAKDETKRISSLMPGASKLRLVRFFGISELTQARLLEWIGKIGRCQAIAENFSKGTAARSSVWR